MSAQVIDLFGRKPQPESQSDVADKADHYARVASGLVDECGRQGLDPEILAASIMAVVLARKTAAEVAPELDAAEPASEPMRYEPQIERFRGSKYTGEWRSAAEIAKDFRADVKAARASGELVLPKHAKVSVRCESYSMGQSINVIIKGLTQEELWNTPDTEWTKVDGEDREVYNGGRTEMRTAAEAKLDELLQAYNSVDSEHQTDYHHALFYGEIRSSEW